MLSVLSYNVNGLARCLGSRSAEEYLKSLSDLVTASAGLFICLQEVKLARKAFTLDAHGIETYLTLPGYGNDVPKAPYAGVGTYYVRQAPGRYLPPVTERRDGCSWAVEKVIDNLDLGECFPSSMGPINAEDLKAHVLEVAKRQIDHEGRCHSLLIGDPPVIAIVNLYGIAVANEGRWAKKICSQVAVECLLTTLEVPTILAGDLNCTHRSNGLDSASDTHRSNGWIAHLCSSYNMYDTLLEVKGADLKHTFTCWNQCTGAKLTNYGSRIDYILAPRSLRVVDAAVHQDVVDSDHCPISATFEWMGELSGELVASLAAESNTYHQKSLTEFFGSGIKRALERPTSPRAKLPQVPEYLSYLSIGEQERYIQTLHVAPRCRGHRLPCILRRVRDRGSPNYGREFWCCCYPTGAESRCNYFAWAKR